MPRGGRCRCSPLRRAWRIVRYCKSWGPVGTCRRGESEQREQRGESEQREQSLTRCESRLCAVCRAPWYCVSHWEYTYSSTTTCGTLLLLQYQLFLEIITNIGLYIPSSSFFFRYVVVSGYDLYPKSADSAYNTPSEYRTKLLKQIRKTQSVLGFGNTGTKDCKVIFYCTRLCVFLSTFTNKCLPVRVSGTCYIWYMLFVICSSFYVQTAHACSSSTLPCFPLLV